MENKMINLRTKFPDTTNVFDFKRAEYLLNMMQARDSAQESIELNYQ